MPGCGGVWDRIDREMKIFLRDTCIGYRGGRQFSPLLGVQEEYPNFQFPWGDSHNHETYTRPPEEDWVAYSEGSLVQEGSIGTWGKYSGEAGYASYEATGGPFVGCVAPATGEGKTASRLERCSRSHGARYIFGLAATTWRFLGVQRPSQASRIPSNSGTTRM
eukprot:gene12884-biopygen309